MNGKPFEPTLHEYAWSGDTNITRRLHDMGVPVFVAGAEMMKKLARLPEATVQKLVQEKLVEPDGDSLIPQWQYDRLRMEADLPTGEDRGRYLLYAAHRRPERLRVLLSRARRRPALLLRRPRQAKARQDQIAARGPGAVHGRIYPGDGQELERSDRRFSSGDRREELVLQFLHARWIEERRRRQELERARLRSPLGPEDPVLSSGEIIGATVHSSDLSKMPFPRLFAPIDAGHSRPGVASRA